MNLKNQIKMYRKQLNLSQESLADHIYVTRQTISNWENGKNYPDINSLVLLSSVFNVSIDELIKGDLEKMKEMVDYQTINKFQKLSIIYTVALVVVVLTSVPLIYYLDWIGFTIWFVLFIFAMVPALKIEKMKKENDVQTFQEITAFMEGKRLDEIEKATEKGKRTYQKISIAILFAAIAFVITYAIMKLIVG